MSFFNDLFGFEEQSPEQVRANFRVQGTKMTSLINHRTFHQGTLTTPRLADLRKSEEIIAKSARRLVVDEVIGDVQSFHAMPDNAGALFQAASQFNLLEMVGPGVSPERGISGYEDDKTQGPACAIACAPGTLYRNYFVPLRDQIGQSTAVQIDCLDELGRYFKNDEHLFWQMRNGYALATEAGLAYITEHLNRLAPGAYEIVKGLVRIGLQWDTEVTLNNGGWRVSQAYCSALPVAYSGIEAKKWEAFARLILEATYEATLLASIQNTKRTGNKRVFLTLVGGGAFGNQAEWIIDAATMALEKVKHEELRVSFISYAGASPLVAEIVERLS